MTCERHKESLSEDLKKKKKDKLDQYHGAC